MKRHSIDHADVALEAALKSAESGPVELVREGEPVAIVPSMTDYNRLVAASRPGFFGALDAARAAMIAEGVDVTGAFDNVRDARDAGRTVKP